MGKITWAALVKDTCDTAFETPEEAETMVDTKAKRTLLIPVNVFTSSMIMIMSSLLGQTDDYKRFGVCR